VIEPPLEADRRRRLRAHCGAAQRAGDVTGVHLDAVTEVAELPILTVAGEAKPVPLILTVVPPAVGPEAVARALGV